MPFKLQFTIHYFRSWKPKIHHFMTFGGWWHCQFSWLIFGIDFDSWIIIKKVK